MTLDIEALYVAHAADIRGFISRHMQGAPSDVIDDLASATWERAIKAAPRYRDLGNPPTSFLYSIARNLITDHYRERSRYTDMGSIDDLGAYVEHVGSDAHVTQLTISKALETYQTGNPWISPDRHLAVIREKYFVGGFDREVGERLGMTEMVVKQLRKRALANLKKQMGDVA